MFFGSFFEAMLRVTHTILRLIDWHEWNVSRVFTTAQCTCRLHSFLSYQLIKQHIHTKTLNYWSVNMYISIIYISQGQHRIFIYLSFVFFLFPFFLCIKEFIHYIEGELKTIETSSICYKCPYHNRCHSSIKC